MECFTSLHKETTHGTTAKLPVASPAGAAKHPSQFMPGGGIALWPFAFEKPSSSDDAANDPVADEAFSILESDMLDAAQKRESLQRLTNRHPDNAAAWAAYAESLQKTGETARALAAFRRASDLDPSLYSPWLWIGILEKRGAPKPDYKAAEAAFRKALDRGAPRARALNELAVTLALQERYREAVEAWKAAIDADPNWGVLYNNVIKGALSLGDARTAGDYAARALDAARFEENAVLLYGEHLVSEGRHGEAANFYARALDKHPLNPRLRYYYGTALGSAGETRRAVAQLVAAKRLSGRAGDGNDLPQAVDWMIFRLEHPKDEEKFQEARKAIFSQSPSEKAITRAIERLDPLIERHPGFWNGYFLRGVAYRRLNKPDEAAADLARVLELSPDEPNATMELALLARDRFDFTRAADLADKALLLAPRDPAFKVNAAFIMIDAGRCARAWAIYRDTVLLVGAENEVVKALRDELDVRCPE
jgi:tetratricopeptide (TPR) repeat protein